MLLSTFIKPLNIEDFFSRKEFKTLCRNYSHKLKLQNQNYPIEIPPRVREEGEDSADAASLLVEAVGGYSGLVEVA